MDIAVDGATLYVEVDGPESNPALLLWPPGRCTLRVWDHLVAATDTPFPDGSRSIFAASVAVRQRPTRIRSTRSSNTPATLATCSTA